MDFPSAEANAFDAIWTASALAKTVDITFFVPRLRKGKEQLKGLYNISGSPLKIQSLHFNHVPDRLLLKFKDYYGKTLFFYLRHHPAWKMFQGQKILYVRHPKMLLFWGQQKAQQAWLRDWTLVYESHDPLGLDPNHFQGSNPFALTQGKEGQYRQRLLKAARNFDLIISNTRAQADDLRSWTNDLIQPHYVGLASPLPRLPEPPCLRPFGEKIVLGYIGTIDQYRGVPILLEAMRFLPQNYVLRIVGRFRQERDVDPSWLKHYLDDPLIGSHVEIKEPVPICEVTDEIDQCDILLLPASSDILDSRYATPQKSFDYMVRGKPIVAGDVPGHREFLKHGKNAILYPLDPRSLAEAILHLVKTPSLAKLIAVGAWKQAESYNLERRANDILSLTGQIHSGRDHCS
jgi:glycosyltransferase involved in cell wall biosynthesis